MIIDIDSTHDQFHEEQQQLIQSLRKCSGTHKSQELEAERDKLKVNHLKIIENIETLEQLEAFKRITAPLEPTMLAIAESCNGMPTNLLAPTTSKHEREIHRTTKILINYGVYFRLRK